MMLNLNDCRSDVDSVNGLWYAVVQREEKNNSAQDTQKFAEL